MLTAVVPIDFHGNSPEKKLVLISAFYMLAVPICSLLQRDARFDKLLSDSTDQDAVKLACIYMSNC